VNIRTKIILGFSVGGFVFLSAGIFSFFSAKNAEVILREFDSVLIIDREKDKIANILVEAVKFQSEERLKDTKKNINVILEQLDNLKKLGLKSAEKVDSSMQDYVVTAGRAVKEFSPEVLQELSEKSKQFQNAVSELKTEFFRKVIAIVGRSALISILLSLLIFAFFIAFAFWLGNSISSRIKDVSLFLKKLAEGGADLTKRIKTTSSDEIDELSRNFNRFLDNMASMVNVLLGSVRRLVEVSERFSGISREMLRKIEEQNHMTASLMTAMEELQATSSEISKNVAEILEFQKNVDAKAGEGKSVVVSSLTKIKEVSKLFDDIMDVLKRVGDAAKEVSSVAEVIEDVADQTNLLSLNASIEAARAGDAGRGFAVVAEEVRKLAQRTQTESTNIKKIMGEFSEQLDELIRRFQILKKQIVEATESAEGGTITIEDISKLISRATELLASISSAMEEQSRSVGGGTRNISQIVSIAEGNRSLLEETSKSVSALYELIKGLEEITSKFKV